MKIWINLNEWVYIICYMLKTMTEVYTESGKLLSLRGELTLIAPRLSMLQAHLGNNEDSFSKSVTQWRLMVLVWGDRAGQYTDVFPYEMKRIDHVRHYYHYVTWELALNLLLYILNFTIFYFYLIVFIKTTTKTCTTYPLNYTWK